MDPSEIRSHKDRLRQINSHLSRAHDEMGVERDAVGFVDVVHHPTYNLPSFNYVTPRRRTAFVPGTHVEEGIVVLRDYRRDVRMLYIEQLFPPFFQESLEKIGLSLQATFPLWVINTSSTAHTFTLPKRISSNVIVNQDGIDIWQLIWRHGSDNYHYHNTPLEPLLLGKQYPAHNRVADVVLYHRDIPVAAARMTLYDKTAHLMARAILKSDYADRLHKLLLQTAITTACKQSCEFMFVSDINGGEFLGKTPDLSCHLEGNMLCYSDSAHSILEEEINDTMEQPVLLT